MPEKFEWKTELEDETIIRTHAWSPPGCHPVGCGLQLHVKDGKIVKATSNNTEYMNEILDIDEGARYVGEFAFGVNPVINHPIGDILFDEKIAGSFHFTPGNSYDNASNGNKSAVHWDLIQIQTPEYGGGEIWFDDVLIRKDGLFVLDDLKCLNPENLLSEDE